MAELASRVYADALFELAQEKELLEPLYEEAESLTAVWKRYPDFVRLLNHPELSKEKKLRMIREVFDKRLSGEMNGFLQVLVQKDRLRDLLGALSKFLDRVREYRKIGTAYVTSAKELSQVQKDKLERQLRDTVGYRTLQMYYSVDPSLIGGLVIRVNGRVIDGSLKTQLSRLSARLMETPLTLGT